MQDVKITFITTADVARMYNVNKSTVTRWVHQKKLVAVHQLGGLRGGFLFDPEEVAKFQPRSAHKK